MNTTSAVTVIAHKLLMIWPLDGSRVTRKMKVNKRFHRNVPFIKPVCKPLCHSDQLPGAVTQLCPAAVAGDACCDLSIMKVDRGSSCISGGCLADRTPLWLPVTFRLEGMTSLCSDCLSQTSLPARLITFSPAEEMRSVPENISWVTRLLVENAGFTSFVLTIFVRTLFWEVTVCFWRRSATSLRWEVAVSDFDSVLFSGDFGIDLMGSGGARRGRDGKYQCQVSLTQAWCIQPPRTNWKKNYPYTPHKAQVTAEGTSPAPLPPEYTEGQTSASPWSRQSSTNTTLPPAVVADRHRWHNVVCLSASGSRLQTEAGSQLLLGLFQVLRQNKLRLEWIEL